MGVRGSISRSERPVERTGPAGGLRSARAARARAAAPMMEAPAMRERRSRLSMGFSSRAPGGGSIREIAAGARRSASPTRVSWGRAGGDHDHGDDAAAAVRPRYGPAEGHVQTAGLRDLGR